MEGQETLSVTRNLGGIGREAVNLFRAAAEASKRMDHDASERLIAEALDATKRMKEDINRAFNRGEQR
jgi:hypothetical protein